MFARPACAVVGLLLAGGCSGLTSGAAEPPRPTPMERLNTDVMRLARADFCDAVPVAAVRRAVGGPPGKPDRWRDGERAPLGGGASDVAREFGCLWRAGGTTAAAWVFAQPVAPKLAGEVVAEAEKRPGCRTVTTDFGSPGLRQRCALHGVRVRYSGLVGDSWLTCELQGRADVASRAGRWCVEVANALNTRR